MNFDIHTIGVSEWSTILLWIYDIAYVLNYLRVSYR